MTPDDFRHQIAGPHHVHPIGEIDLIMPIDADARFDGRPAGWSAHRAVRTGRRSHTAAHSCSICCRKAASTSPPEAGHDRTSLQLRRRPPAAGRWSPGTGAGMPLFDPVLGHEPVRALNFYHRSAALQASTTVLAALDK